MALGRNRWERRREAEDKKDSLQWLQESDDAHKASVEEKKKKRKKAEPSVFHKISAFMLEVLQARSE